MKARRWRPIGTAALAVAAACVSAGRADAAIYWTYNSVSPRTHEVRGHISRANLNGKHVDLRFINLKRHILPWGVAVDRQHLYWTAASAPAVGIGRAKLDGSGVDQGFMPATAFGESLDVPTFEVTVAGNHIYWPNTGLGTIGRANLDGSDANPAFIVAAHVPDAIAVAGGYVYWGNIPAPGEDTVGRAKINGSQVNERFLRHTTALALATKGRYLYGSDFDHIWRAHLDGSHLKRRFITAPSGPEGLAVR